MKCTSVYLIHNSWSIANYKVGLSSNPARRIGEILVNYDVEPVLITTAWFTEPLAAKTAETWWHRYLKEFRTDDHPGDEWFSMTEQLLSNFKKWSAKSRSQCDHLSWMLQASREERNNYDTQLLKAIPRHNNPPRISVWRNQEVTQKRYLMLR